MLRIVLWLSAGCAVLLAALAISRSVDVDEAPAKKRVTAAPAVEEVAAPAVAKAPARQPSAPVESVPEDVQVQEDAAAVGLTTVEPETPVLDVPAAEAPPT